MSPSPFPSPVPVPAFTQPGRGIEARAWLSRHHAEARAWQGTQAETLLHWGAMSDVGLLLDLAAAGLDPNAPDGDARTPLDWLNDRLWFACVENAARLTVEGRYRLRAQTEELVPALWGIGGRPGVGIEGLDPGSVWARAGAWPLLELLRDEGRGLDGWRRWGRHRESVLHAWTVAPESPEKHRFLARALDAGLSVDEPDAAGRTPLWYAIDAWLARPGQADASNWKAAIRALLAAGADPDRAAVDGSSPAELPVLTEAEPALADAIAELFAAPLPPA